MPEFKKLNVCDCMAAVVENLLKQELPEGSFEVIKEEANMYRVSVTIGDIGRFGFFGSKVNKEMGYFVFNRGIYNYMESEGFNEKQISSAPLYLEISSAKGFVNFLLGSSDYLIMGKDCAKKV